MSAGPTRGVGAPAPGRGAELDQGACPGGRKEGSSWGVSWEEGEALHPSYSRDAPCVGAAQHCPCPCPSARIAPDAAVATPHRACLPCEFCVEKSPPHREDVSVN